MTHKVHHVHAPGATSRKIASEFDRLACARRSASGGCILALSPIFFIYTNCARAIYVCVPENAHKIRDLCCDNIRPFYQNTFHSV